MMLRLEASRNFQLKPCRNLEDIRFWAELFRILTLDCIYQHVLDAEGSAFSKKVAMKSWRNPRTALSFAPV